MQLVRLDRGRFGSPGRSRGVGVPERVPSMWKPSVAMSASPSRFERRVRPRLAVPIARPPDAASTSSPLESRRPLIWSGNWWTPEAEGLGWLGALHTILACRPGFWYFAPRLQRPITFDSRLAGSPTASPRARCSPAD